MKGDILYPLINYFLINFHKLSFKISVSLIVYSDFKSKVGATLLSSTIIVICYSLQIGSKASSSIRLSVNFILNKLAPIFKELL